MGDENRGGVHQKNKYAEIKEALGIPEDEPIFILRAQDQLSPSMIDLYDLLYMSTAKAAGIDVDSSISFSNEIQAVYDEFRTWQKQNSVKVPD